LLGNLLAAILNGFSAGLIGFSNPWNVGQEHQILVTFGHPTME
jgi:hypothetical protein